MVAVERNPQPVRLAVDLEPAGRAALLRGDPETDALREDLGASAGERSLPGVAEALQHLANGERRDAGHRLDLGRGEEVRQHVREAPPGLADQVQVVLEGEGRVVPSLEEDRGGAPLHGPGDLRHDLVDGEGVGLGVARLPVEGAELAVGDADVRVVRVRVDRERHLAAGVEAAAHGIGELADLEQGGLGQEPPALLAGEPDLAVDLGADRLLHRLPCHEVSPRAAPAAGDTRRPPSRRRARSGSGSSRGSR